MVEEESNITAPAIFACLQINNGYDNQAMESIQKVLGEEKGVNEVTIISANKARVHFDHTLLGPRDVLDLVKVS